MQPGIETAILSNLKKNSIKDNLLVSFETESLIQNVFGDAKRLTESPDFAQTLLHSCCQSHFSNVPRSHGHQNGSKEQAEKGRKGILTLLKAPLRVLTTSIPRKGKVDTSGTPNDIQICLLPG